MKKLILNIFFIIFISQTIFTQPLKQTSAFQIARVKYNGGGDWYIHPSSDINMLNFLKENTSVKVLADYTFVDLSSEYLFLYPFIFLTGHGNISLSDFEVKRLRSYLENGGFLYVDDDYGLDKAFRRELKRVFPETELVELPFKHGLYHNVFDFPNGPPKTHLHDNKPPQGLGIFLKGRLVVYYTYESNPSDGWVDKEVYNDPEEKRFEAFKFGTNLIVWALTN